jgi:hypothetical protein
VAGSCQHSNELSSSIRSWEFDLLSVIVASHIGLCSMELVQHCVFTMLQIVGTSIEYMPIWKL